MAATDALLGFPVRSFGTEYRIATFGGSPNGLYPRAVIIAEEDNTQVTFSAVRHFEIEGNLILPGEQYTITLNRGEDFHLKPLPYGHDLSGTGIIADKPIGVFSGHDCAFIPRGGIAWCNRTVDQLPSIDLWKNSYLTTPLRSRYGDIFQVLAAHDSTEVSINGCLLYTSPSPRDS